MRNSILSILIFSWLNILHAVDVLPTIKPVDDIISGYETAPITVVEYSSLNCVACAAFHHTVFSTLKKEYIDTGKVRFIFRHFPLDEQAAKVAAVVSTAPAIKQLTLINRLFAQQQNWINTTEPAQKLSRITDIPVGACLAAMNNKKLTDAVFQKRLDAERDFRIDGTPTFVINGKIYDELPTLENFEKAFNAKLPKAKTVK